MSEHRRNLRTGLTEEWPPFTPRYPVRHGRDACMVEALMDLEADELSQDERERAEKERRERKAAA